MNTGDKPAPKNTAGKLRGRKMRLRLAKGLSNIMANTTELMAPLAPTAL